MALPMRCRTTIERASLGTLCALKGIVVHYRHALGNDRWIAEKIFPGLRDGYFVEAGASDGINDSATYVLETERGWSGLCIEPIPAQMEKIKAIRNCSLDNRALWRESDQEIAFTLYNKRMGHSAITSVNKNVEKMGRRAETWETINVNTVTLKDVLTDHSAPREIDYLCLDVEGAEFEILNAFDLHDQFLIRAITIEGNACNALMQDAGYQQVEQPFTDLTMDTYWLHPSLI